VIQQGMNFNFFAVVALVGMLLSAFVVLFARKPEDTVYLLVMAAVMFLPVDIGFKLPKVPRLDKDTLPYLMLFLTYFLRRTRWVGRSRLLRGVDFLIIVSMGAALLTMYNNPDPVFVTGYQVTKVLPGLTLNDGLAMAGEDLLRLGIPFMLGRVLVRSPREGHRLLLAFAVAGVVYSLFILWEVRMSPQLHAVMYGASPRKDDFSQTLRFGGYRPVVFMPHGLAVALFVCNTVLAAFVLARNRTRILGLPARPVAFYLFFILIACKSLATIIYAFFAVPLLAFTRARAQLRVAALIGMVVLLYPALRGSDLFPARQLVAAFASVSPDRAESLEFRINNEDQLLDHARDRPYFGWGSYGRNIVYDKESGKEATTFDGFWIIMFSMRGAVGSACAFLLLLVPVFQSMRKLRRIPDKKDQLLLAGLAVMVAVSVADLLPNGLFLTYPYFMAGSLMGLLKTLTSPQSRPAPGDPLPVEASVARP
jgi:hypothetical protein